MIRRATLDDLEAVIAIGERVIDGGAFERTGLNYMHAMAHLMRARVDPMQWLAVAVHEGRIVGFMLLVAQQVWWNLGNRIVLDDAFFCERPGLGRALIREGLKWARSVPGVVDIIFSLNSQIGTERSVKALQKYGFEPRGVTLQAPVDRKGRARWAA